MMLRINGRTDGRKQRGGEYEQLRSLIKSLKIFIAVFPEGWASCRFKKDFEEIHFRTVASREEKQNILENIFTRGLRIRVNAT